MKYKAYLFALFLMLYAGGSTNVAACVCAQTTESVCEKFGAYDAVFVGKVVGGKELRKETDDNGQETVYAQAETYFQVDEAFLGADAGSRITLYDDFTTCDYPFRIGETYLVYAERYEKKLRTGICSPTRPLSEAGEELPDLRQLAKENSGTRISGVVGYLGLLEIEPLAKNKVRLQTLTGKSISSETLTDEKGAFSFSNVPEGTYKLLPTIPGLMKLDRSEDFEIQVTGRGCKSKGFTFVNDAGFSGRLLNPQGRPVADTEVEFIPANNNFDIENYENLSAWTATTDEAGNFTFENIAPGNYYLAVNYKSPPNYRAHLPTTFYPQTAERSKARTFKVKLGQKTNGVDFTIPPPLKEMEISGTIAREDGQSPADLMVYLIDVGVKQNFITDFKVIYDDNDGSFTLKGYEGRTYVLEAGEFVSEDRQTLSEKFTLTKPASGFRLSFKKQ